MRSTESAHEIRSAFRLTQRTDGLLLEPAQHAAGQQWIGSERLDACLRFRRHFDAPRGVEDVAAARDRGPRAVQRLAADDAIGGRHDGCSPAHITTLFTVYTVLRVMRYKTLHLSFVAHTIGGPSSPLSRASHLNAQPSISAYARATRFGSSGCLSRPARQSWSA